MHRPLQQTKFNSFTEKEKISSSFSIPHIPGRWCAYDVTSAEWLVEESEAKDPISLDTFGS
jgi:hypothetical protein